MTNRRNIQKIVGIHEVSNIDPDTLVTDGKRFGMCDGYRVELSRLDYYVLIGNGQSCCENWGYMHSEDDIQSFVGATLLDVKLDGTPLDRIVDKIPGQDEGGAMFVTFETDRGSFQLVAYNAHNGYYSHSAYVVRDDRGGVRKAATPEHSNPQTLLDTSI
jgi:hypothetical protein